MNGHAPAPSSRGPLLDTSQLTAHNSENTERRDQNHTRPYNGKSLYEQRKTYTKNSINSLMETSQYRVEHLTTFSMDLKEAMFTVEDGLRKLKLLEAKGKVWTQEMLLQVDDKAISLIDADTKNELEIFPLTSVVRCQALMDTCSYDSILALMCKEPGQAKPDLHLFQCNEIKANLIHADIDSAISDLKARTKKRPETLRMILNSDGIIPPPPSEPAPPAPPAVAEAHFMSRVAAWSPSAANETADYDRFRQLFEQDESPEAVAARVDCDVQILNRLLDDIEYFVIKLQRATEAFNELSKKTKAKKGKTKGPGEGVLTLRATPQSQEEFIDCFQKFKHAFNLLAKLRLYINNPSASDLVHFLFTPLNMVVQATGGVELARSVVSPLLTREAIDFLHSCGTTQERHLWVTLGDGWTKCRLEWPKDHYIPPYVPRFRDGWQPPSLPPLDLGCAHGREMLGSVEQEEAEQRLALEQPGGQLFSPADGNYESQDRASMKNYARCKYEFAARNNTELSVVKDEIVEVLDDRKQWWKVRNSAGACGYVPNNIMEVTRVMGVSGGWRESISGHTVQKQRTDTVHPPAINSIPPTPVPPPTAVAPVLALPPVPVPDARSAPSWIPTPPLPPPAAPPLLEQRDSPVSSSSSDSGSVTLREQKREEPLSTDRRKSNMEEVRDELLHRLTLGRSTQKKIQVPPRSNSLPSMLLTYDSSPDEVKAWLEVKGFNPVTVNSLGVLTGAQLFSLNKEELKTVCPDDGARVYSQVTMQKTTLERSSGSELQEVMRRRQEKITTAAGDSGVESFDEGSGH